MKGDFINPIPKPNPTAKTQFKPIRKFSGFSPVEIGN